MHYVESSGFFSSYIFVSSVFNVVLRVRQLNGRHNMCVLIFVFLLRRGLLKGLCVQCVQLMKVFYFVIMTTIYV